MSINRTPKFVNILGIYLKTYFFRKIMKPWEKYEHLILEASLDQNRKAFITRKLFIMIVYVKLNFYTYFTKNQQRN